MRVLLVQPRQRRRAGFKAGFRSMAVVEPLGLEMVGAALQDEHEVALIDLLPGVDLDRTVERFSPDVCGISCSFTVDVDRSLEIAAAVKTLKPKAFVLVGGHHASLNPTDFAVPSVDAVVVGEGEVTTPALVRGLSRGDDLTSVPGLVLATSAGQRATGPRPLVADLDTLPLAARSLTRGLRKKYHLGVRGSTGQSGDLARVSVSLHFLQCVAVPPGEGPSQEPGTGGGRARNGRGEERVHHRR